MNAEIPAMNRPMPTVSVPSGREMRLLSVGCEADWDGVGSVNDKQADVTCWPGCHGVS